MQRRLVTLALVSLLLGGTYRAANARTLDVRSGGAYTNLEAAAAAALPGDTIMFHAGTYPGGQAVTGLQGRDDAPIVITTAPGEEVILQGGTNAWQLSDPAYLIISGFVLQGQTGNGLNIDDAGTFDTPAHHIIIERCEWRGIDATGNNDLLKLSGIDSFQVRDCFFHDGAAGGSMVDMVGCHYGLFLRNRFERAGSNCIQAKGGTRYIRIERNTFIDGGARALNIGGSTGLQFFRPQGADYESSDIAVYSNVFVGSDAPLAFVGTVRSAVINNTIFLPKRWAIRILQETTAPEFLQCGDNVLMNNIIVVGNVAANPTVNIGPSTRPETFVFANNLWYDVENPNWSGPNLPSTEINGMIGRDPLLSAPPGDLSIRPGSPAIGTGAPTTDPTVDYLGRPFAAQRSIGAYEGAAPITSVAQPDRAEGVRVFGSSREGGLQLVLAARAADAPLEIALYSTDGRRALALTSRLSADGTAHVPVEHLAAGLYLCVVRWGERSMAAQLLAWR